MTDDNRIALINCMLSRGDAADAQLRRHNRQLACAKTLLHELDSTRLDSPLPSQRPEFFVGPDGRWIRIGCRGAAASTKVDRPLIEPLSSGQAAVQHPIRAQAYARHRPPDIFEAETQAVEIILTEPQEPAKIDALVKVQRLRQVDRERKRAQEMDARQSSLPKLE